MRYGKVFLSAAQHCFPSTANCTPASSGQNHPHVKSFGDGVQKMRTESLPKPFLLLKHNCIQWKRAREKDFFFIVNMSGQETGILKRFNSGPKVKPVNCISFSNSLICLNQFIFIPSLWKLPSCGFGLGC